MITNDTPPRGRWAPSPTGLLHVGSARTALVAWLSVRSRGGSFIWRVEDLDPPRQVEGSAEAALQDLAWLGLDWDEGPDVDGPHAPYRQSLRSHVYREALEFLASQQRIFPCRLSRKDLKSLATAPHGPETSQPYPKHARPRQLEPDWYEPWRQASCPDAALRFRVDDAAVEFIDLVVGPVRQRVDREVGDFVLQRRDGLFAYQLAVVVDDLAMGVDEVVRGEDLLASTGRQIQLIRALTRPGGETPFPAGSVPQYAHVPLLVNADGEKLSKRDDAMTLASLRLQGVRPEQLVGWLAASLGLLAKPEACTATDLIEHFDWAKLAGAGRQEETPIQEDLAPLLRSL